MENGQWEALSDPTCPDKPQKCYGDIRVVRESTNNWATDLNSANDVGTVVSYTCDMSDTSLVVTSKCAPDGQWTPPMPSVCPIAPQCCAADPYFNGDLVTRTWDNSHDLGAEAEYECVLARIPEQATATINSHCQANGTWSKLNPTIETVCYTSECFHPESINEFEVDGERLGDIATQQAFSKLIFEHFF